MASIEKRSRQDGRASWRAHYRTPSGEQRNKTFNRKAEAERFLASVESSKNTGSFVDSVLARITVGDWATHWLDNQTHLKPSTHERYAGIIREHIRPKWDRVKLANVSHADVQKWVTALSKTRSPATVRKVHRVLSLILNMAVKDGRLARNVATGVNLPRRPRRSSAISTHDQVEALARRAPAQVTSSKHRRLDEREKRDLPARRPVPCLHRRPIRRDGRTQGRPARPHRRRATIAESVTVVQGKGLVWGIRNRTNAGRCQSHGSSSPSCRDHIADKVARRAGVQRRTGRRATTRSDLPRRLPRRGLGDRHSRIAPAPAAPHRSQPRHRQRRGRQSRAADARPFERRDDDGRLRTPLQRPPRRGRRRARHRPNPRPPNLPLLLANAQNPVAKCCQTPMWSTWPPTRRKVKPQVRRRIRMAPPARFELALPPPEGGALSPELRGHVFRHAAAACGPKGNVPARLRTGTRLVSQCRSRRTWESIQSAMVQCRYEVRPAALTQSTSRQRHNAAPLVRDLN